MAIKHTAVSYYGFNYVEHAIEDFKEMKEQVKELFKRSSVIRVIIDRNNKIIMNIPLTIGVVGVALLPIYTLVGLSAAVIGKCRIKIQNEDDGSIERDIEGNIEFKNVFINCSFISLSLCDL